MAWIWITMAMPAMLIAYVFAETIRERRMRRRRWQHDPRPRTVVTRDGYELDRGGL